MKVAFIMPARDKIHGIDQAVESVLRQTYSPMELIFSDQGSTDGTLQRIEALSGNYDGKNTVRVIHCPLHEFKGMMGVNAHIDWIMSQTDADFIVQCTADDVNDIDRAAKTVAAYKETGASMVNAGIQFMQTDGDSEATRYPTKSGFVTATEVMRELVGGST